MDAWVNMNKLWLSLMDLSKTLSIREGWITFVLTLLPIMVVVSVVKRANWVDTPSLYMIVIVAGIGSLTLSKINRHWLFLHTSGLVLGGIVVIWQSSLLTDASEWIVRLDELQYRILLWLRVASSPNISNDTLPFSAFVTSVAWLISYISVWSVFRWRNPWLSVVLTGVVILSCLSYLPDNFKIQFFIFLILSILLIVRVIALKREVTWKKDSVTYSNSLSLFNLNNAFWIGLLAILFATLMPFDRGTVPIFADLWTTARSPVIEAQSGIQRLFAGVPSRRDFPFRTFGETLPFQGPLLLNSDPVFLVRSLYPSYWRIRSYPIYTSSGWITGPVLMEDSDWLLEFGFVENFKKRLEISHSVETRIPTSTVLSLGYPMYGPAIGNVDVMPPKTFSLSMVSDEMDEDLPSELKNSISNLRNLWEITPANRRVELLVSLLPVDVNIVRVVKSADLNPEGLDSGEEGDVVNEIALGPDYIDSLREVLTYGDELLSVDVERQKSNPLDVLALRGFAPMESNLSYDMVSSVFIRSFDDLRGAGGEYPNWVLDSYLQLPETMPLRIADLANELTNTAVSPYDKVTAIKEYLEGLSYTLQIDPIPLNNDGVDHFLFVSRTGYGDYFASAMVTMLRSIGIPSRIVAGYREGQYDVNRNVFIVRDTDSHVWVEIFFPEYGWIEFDPSPGFEVPDPMSVLDQGIGGGGGYAIDIDLGAGLIDEYGSSPISSVGAGPAQGLDVPWLDMFIGVFVFLFVILAVLGILWYLWFLAFVSVNGPTKIYARMRCLGNWSGIKPKTSQTPEEYSARLAKVEPNLGISFNSIARAYSSITYGSNKLTIDEEDNIILAWRSIRRILLRRILTRR